VEEKILATATNALGVYLSHNRLVVGANPAGPTTNDFLFEVLDLKEMIGALLGTAARRKLRLQKKSNSELFQLYAGELTVRHRSAAALKESKRLMGHFEDFLGLNSPTAELATSFLARFGALTSNTIYRYHAIINGFMTWYGERLETKVKVPKTLQEYIEDGDVDKLKDALRQNKSHKGVIERNLLLVEIMSDSGLRRAEVASLEIGDIDFQRQCLVVRRGKGEKDRIVDLIPSLSESLRRYIGDRPPEQAVFGLNPGSISDIIRRAARRAGVDLHAHSLRDYFATRLLDRGVDLEIIRRLLGHESLEVTRRYLGRTDSQRREAVNRLQSPVESIASEGRTLEGLQSSKEPGALFYKRIHNHQRNLLRLVGRWRNELNPIVWKNPIRDFGKPGIHRGQGDASLAWQVTSDGKISLCLPLELAIEKETAITRGYLWQHLGSGHLPWLVSDPQRGLLAWRQIGGEELAKRISLLLAINRACREVTGLVPQSTVRKVGPVPAFCDTIWAAVTDGVYADLSYNIETDQESGFRLIKYGAYTVAQAINNEDGQRNIEWHKELMARWKSDPITKDIVKLIAARKRIADEIDDILAKLLVDGHIAGRCEGCPNLRSDDNSGH